MSSNYVSPRVDSSSDDEERILRMKSRRAYDDDRGGRPSADQDGSKLSGMAGAIPASLGAIMTGLGNRAAASLPEFGFQPDQNKRSSSPDPYLPRRHNPQPNQHWQDYLLKSAPESLESPVVDINQYMGTSKPAGNNPDAGSKSKRSNTMAAGSVFCVVHKVVCSCKKDNALMLGVLDFLGKQKSKYSPMQVNGTFYWAVMPQAAVGNNGKPTSHLAGEFAIPNLQEFVSKIPKVVFVVVHSNQCGVEQPHVTEMNRADNVPRLRRFQIWLLHRGLKQRFRKYFKMPLLPTKIEYRPKSVDYGSDSDFPKDRSRERPAGTSDSQWAQEPLSKTDSYSHHDFLRHHRKLTEIAEKGDDNDGIPFRALLRYVKDLQGRLHDFYQSNLEKGLIHPSHLELLYRYDGMVVTSRNSQFPRAYNIHNIIYDDNQIKLSCWCWEFDGYQFSEVSKSFIAPEASWETQTIMRIDNLEVFPFQFANDALQDELRHRGQKFWNLRKRGHVLYSGWTYDSRCLFKASFLTVARTIS